MRCILPLFFLGSVIVFAGCAPVDEVVSDPPLRIDIQELNVSFVYHEPLSLRVSMEEALLSGATTHMQVQTLAYTEKILPANDRLPSWVLPAAIAGRIRDERSCSALNDASVFLPVDTMTDVRCDLVIDPSGRPVVWMVGIGRPFEALPFMQSALLVLEDTQFHLFSYVYPFPEAETSVRWMFETFEERHPPMSPLLWPNTSFKILADEVRTLLRQEISSSSAEVQSVMDALRTLAFSVGPSRGNADQ